MQPSRPQSSASAAYRTSSAAPGPQRPPQRRSRRRLKRSVRRTLSLVLSVVLLLGTAWGITALIERGNLPEDGSPSTTATSAVPQPQPGSGRFVGPVLQEADTMRLSTLSQQDIALPENGRIDAAFFNSVVFIGDSITQGLPKYLPNAHYAAYLGASPRHIYDGSIRENQDGVMEVPMEAIISYQPENVYILLGTNTMVNILDDEVLLAYFSEMLDALRNNLGPDVGIYLQSITPVLQGVDERFSAARIAGLNEALAQLAYEKGAYFVNLCEVLGDSEGWLYAEYGASDGYHLQPAGYRAWVEYLITHTAYNTRHARYYLEGSPYYQPLQPA